MRIEAIQLYNQFGCHIPSNCPNVDFVSIPEIAWFVRGILQKSQLYEAMVWIDNQRYMLVTNDTYDIHYHGFFNNFKSQKHEKE